MHTEAKIEGLSAQTCVVQILSFEKISFEVPKPNFVLTGLFVYQIASYFNYIIMI